MQLGYKEHLSLSSVCECESSRGNHCFVQPNVNGDASHVHSIICWRCTQPHVLGINDFITFLRLCLSI